VPVNHGETKVIAQGFALDDLGRVIVFEGQRIFGGGALVFDGCDVFECSGHMFSFVVEQNNLRGHGNG
jgi:hypothetical protein